MTPVVVHHPSWARYRRLVRNSADRSVLRCLEYERLADLKLTGLVLDFGGGNRTNYSSIAAGWGDPERGYHYQSANIDPGTDPTYLIKPGEPLPVAAQSIDTVLSFNTLEHIYDLSTVLPDLHRVLKPQGCLILIVPFIFRVHGHPDDYLRGTPSFWSRRLQENGFTDIRIEALRWGPFSTAQSVSGTPGPLKSLRRHIALLLDVVYAALRGLGGRQQTTAQDDPACATALGYFIEAVRR